MTPEHYTFRPSMFFEGRYQVVDAKGTPIGAARDLSDAETITRSLNKAGREQVEPLEAENTKLRALVQRLVDALGHIEVPPNLLTDKVKAAVLAIDAANEQCFVPTNTTEG